MRKVLSFVLIAIIACSTALLAEESAKVQQTPYQSREDVYILIKDELQLTVAIYKSQVEILSMMVTLQQLGMDTQNADLSSQIENLKRLRQYEGKVNADQVAILQEQLNISRNDLSIASMNLDQLNARVKQSEMKIQDYYNNVIKLARQFVVEVENNRKTDLPKLILPTMKESFTRLAKANVQDGMDAEAFDLFTKAVDEYIRYVISYGGPTEALTQQLQNMIQSYNSAEFTQSQYAELRIYMQNLQKMLDAEKAEKQDLQRKLDELIIMPVGKTYDDKIYFASGSAELDNNAIKILKQFAASTPDTDDYEIMITGYTDSTPIGSKLKSKYATNWELSLARSAKVVHYMLETLKFPPEKIIIAGKGEYAADPNDKDMSRRVEFRFVPKTRP